MKLPGLLAPLVLGGGAVSALGKVEIVADKALRSEGQVLLGKGMSRLGGISVMIGTSELTNTQDFHTKGKKNHPSTTNTVEMAPQYTQPAPMPSPSTWMHSKSSSRRRTKPHPPSTSSTRMPP